MNKEQSSSDILPPKWVLFSLFLVGLVWLLIELKELVTLLVVSYSIAYALDPVVSFIEKRKVARPIAIFLAFGSIILAISLVLMTAAPTLIEEYDRLTTNLGTYIDVGQERLKPWIALIQSKFPTNWSASDRPLEAFQNVPWLKEYVNGETVSKVAKGFLAALLGGYSITLTLVNLVLLPFLVFYLLLDFHEVNQTPIAWAPLTKRKKLESLFGEINCYVSAFLRGQITVCAILFVLYAIGLGIIGVELWLLLALIAGFGNIVPYLGFWVGILLSSLMALVTFGDMSHVFMVWGVFAIVQALESTVITPKVLGESVGLSPLAIILALVIGGQMFGLLGIFLAVPVAAAARVIGRHMREWMVAGI